MPRAVKAPLPKTVPQRKKLDVRTRAVPFIPTSPQLTGAVRRSGGRQKYNKNQSVKPDGGSSLYANTVPVALARRDRSEFELTHNFEAR